MNKIISIFTICIFIVACSPSTPEATPTLIKTETPSPTITVEPTATTTEIPSPTPTQIIYLTLGSPFASDCGDGIPRIWSNDSFNGPFKADGFDDQHGHVDIFVPEGCDVTVFQGEVLAPVSGKLQSYPDGTGYFLFLPKNSYLKGLEDALAFAGVENPKLSSIQEIKLDFGHLKVSIDLPTSVLKGQSIGDIIPCCGHQKLAYQISVYYHNVEYMFSPTLFTQDHPIWQCVTISPYDCEPESKDYAP